MKRNKAVSFAEKIGSFPLGKKHLKKWKKRIKHVKWIPRIYKKRKHLGNVVYSVMYLAAKKDK